MKTATKLEPFKLAHELCASMMGRNGARKAIVQKEHTWARRCEPAAKRPPEFTLK